MSEIKLLPCPFCQAKLKRWDYMPSVFFEHPYNGCILSGKKVLESEHDINAWNTRKPMERIIERLEERHNNHENNIKKYQDKKDYDMCSRHSNIKVENEIAIEIVKEEGGIE